MKMGNKALLHGKKLTNMKQWQKYGFERMEKVCLHRSFNNLIYPDVDGLRKLHSSNVLKLEEMLLKIICIKCSAARYYHKFKRIPGFCVTIFFSCLNFSVE